MDLERLETLSTAELEDLRSKIELLLTERRTLDDRGGARDSERGEGRGIGPGYLGVSGREVLEERPYEQGVLRREVATGQDGPTGGPRWYLYYYVDTKTGKRRLISENLGIELPEEYRS